MNLSFTIQIHLVHDFKNFLKILFFLWLPVSWMPGSLFKMYITQWKFAKNLNGSGTSLVGPGGVVWWKNQTSKISCYCPFNLYDSYPSSVQVRPVWRLSNCRRKMLFTSYNQWAKGLSPVLLIFAIIEYVYMALVINVSTISYLLVILSLCIPICEYPLKGQGHEIWFG